jgi:hypothetical protein
VAQDAGGQAVAWRQISPMPLTQSLGGRLVRVVNGVVVVGDLTKGGDLDRFVRDRARRPRPDVIMIVLRDLALLEGVNGQEFNNVLIRLGFPAGVSARAGRREDPRPVLLVSEPAGPGQPAGPPAVQGAQAVPVSEPVRAAGSTAAPTAVKEGGAKKILQKLKVGMFRRKAKPASTSGQGVQAGPVSTSAGQGAQARVAAELADARGVSVHVGTDPTYDRVAHEVSARSWERTGAGASGEPQLIHDSVPGC